MSLFTIFNGTDGSLTLFLEERDANLELLEDITDQVPLLALARLRDAGGRFLLDPSDFSDLERARNAVPTMSARIAKMSEKEALDLADEIITAVKFNRALQGKSTKLELVK